MSKIYSMLVGMVLILLASCANAEVASQVVKITDGYIRATPPMSTTTGSYMTLKNTGKDDHKMIAAISPYALQVQLHKTEKIDGVYKMIEQPYIDLPAGKTFHFNPGQYHVMLIHLHRALYAGEVIPVYVIFKDGSHEKVMLPVRLVK